MSDDYIICSHCGAELPAKATFCRHCGASDEFGWNDEADYDEILPGGGLGDDDDDFDYDDYLRREFPGHAHGPAAPDRRRGFRRLVALLLIAALLLPALMALLWYWLTAE